MDGTRRRREGRKARLRRETLRVLDRSDLEVVVGGVRVVHKHDTGYVNGRCDTRYCLD
jgi:hypothetical protein